MLYRVFCNLFSRLLNVSVIALLFIHFVFDFVFSFCWPKTCPFFLLPSTVRLSLAWTIFSSCRLRRAQWLLASCVRVITTSFVMYVRPLAHPHGMTRLDCTDILEMRYLTVFPKIWPENRSSVKIWKGRVLHMCIFYIRLNTSQNERCFREIFTENKNIHFMFNNFFFENAVCYIRWTNMVQPDRPQIIVHEGACTLKAPTESHTKGITHLAFPLQHWLH
jgi:hypothetical protein